MREFYKNDGVEGLSPFEETAGSKDFFIDAVPYRVYVLFGILLLAILGVGLFIFSHIGYAFTHSGRVHYQLKEHASTNFMQANWASGHRIM